MNETSETAIADIGLVCALPIELRAFMKKCEKQRSYEGSEFTFRGGRYDGVRIAVVETGMGQQRAARATRALIEAHAPKWIVSTGFCGGLTDDVRIGHMVMANDVVSAAGQSFRIDLSVEGNPQVGLHVGRMFTSEELVRMVDEKQAIAERYAAVAVDMEAWSVASVCREYKTPFMVVKSVSDDLSADLPAEVLSIVGESGSMRLGAAIGSVFKRPGSIKQMWKLRENAWTAGDHLASFLDGVVMQLFRSISTPDQ